VARDSAETREKLLRAAEYLFARHGLDVPIRDIHAQAGQRNASALHYHFGGKRELVLAILEKHTPSPEEIEAIRADLRARVHEPRSVVEAIVGRFAAQLATPEGRDHIRLTFQITIRAPVRRNLLVDGLEDPWDTTLAAETALIRESLPHLPDEVVRERAVAGLLFVLLQVAERARIVDDEDDTQLLDEDEFVTNLIDMTTAALTAPVSTNVAMTTAARGTT
jgi:TetR/AcrR family transcriptional regulator, regulator of cefoperazone and chloramphenicol sensitivity